jgi:HK97 gp10 family phage protein
MLKSRFPAIAAELEPLTRGALEAGAELVSTAAKGRVVVGERTPHLRDAIHTDSEPEGVYVVAGDKETFYGHMVEHGTSHSAPQPFLIPALEETRSEVLALVAEALRHA